MIVEPVAGSAGVLPPPKGYLERLRAICDRHGILLIFDEVITGFGRLGEAFAAERFGVTPDLMTTAKGITNGAVPMGAVFVQRAIHDAFMQGPPEAIELLPRLHLFRPSGGLRRRAWRPSTSIGARACSTRVDEPGGGLGRAPSTRLRDVEERHRHPQHRPDGRDRARAAPGAPARAATPPWSAPSSAAFWSAPPATPSPCSPPLIITEAQIGELFAILRGVLEAID